MSRMMSQTVRCAVCGQESEQTVRISAFVQDTGLDQKPVGALPPVQECPHCRYAALRLDAPAPPAVCAAVQDPAYRSWWAAQPDPALRRTEAAARLAMAGGDPLAAARLQLLAAWYAEDAGQPQKAAGHRQAYLQLVEQSGQSLGPADMLVYLDTLRQAGRTEQALAAARRYEPAFLRGAGAQGLYYRLLQRQLELCGRADTAPHTMSEV